MTFVLGRAHIQGEVENIMQNFFTVFKMSQKLFKSIKTGQSCYHPSKLPQFLGHRASPNHAQYRTITRLCVIRNLGVTRVPQYTELYNNAYSIINIKFYITSNYQDTTYILIIDVISTGCRNKNDEVHL